VADSGVDYLIGRCVPSVLHNQVACSLDRRRPSFVHNRNLLAQRLRPNRSSFLILGEIGTTKSRLYSEWNLNEVSGTGRCEDQSHTGPVAAPDWRALPGIRAVEGVRGADCSQS
jgi:hypothetical protein